MAAIVALLLPILLPILIHVYAPSLPPDTELLVTVHHLSTPGTIDSVRRVQGGNEIWIEEPLPPGHAVGLWVQECGGGWSCCSAPGDWSGLIEILPSLSSPSKTVIVQGNPGFEKKS